jgi:hypothetical protein
LFQLKTNPKKLKLPKLCTLEEGSFYRKRKVKLIIINYKTELLFCRNPVEGKKWGAECFSFRNTGTDQRWPTVSQFATFGDRQF